MIFPDSFILIMSKTNGKAMCHLWLPAGIYKERGEMERSEKMLSLFQNNKIKRLMSLFQPQSSQFNKTEPCNIIH